MSAELRARHGTTSRRRLRDLGYTDDQIRGLVRRGVLVALGRGVFRSPIVPPSLLQRAALACAVTGGAIAFPTAGVLWELRRTPNASHVHVVVPWRRRVEATDGVRVRRSRQLPKADVIVRDDGIAVTTPARTLVDAAATIGPADLESMIEDALYRHLVSVRGLEVVARRLHHPCRDGSLLMSQVMTARPGSARPVASDYELRLERALRRRGFPEFVRQSAVEIANGRIVHPDLGLPADGFYIEIDHRRWHGFDSPVAYDTWRDRQLRLRGLWIERVSDSAIDERLDETVEDLYAAWQRARRAGDSVA